MSDAQLRVPTQARPRRGAALGVTAVLGVVRAGIGPAPSSRRSSAARSRASRSGRSPRGGPEAMGLPVRRSGTPRPGTVTGAVLAAVLLAGCAADRPPADGGTSPTVSSERTRAPASASGVAIGPSPSIVAAISALPVTSSLWMGTNDLLLEVFDETYQPIANREVPVIVQLERPDGTWLPEQAAHVDQPTPGARRLYVARVELDRTGTWQLHLRTDGAVPRATRMSLEVLPDDGSPALGTLFPVLDTPTATSDPGGIAAITTMPGADPAFYERSVAELIERSEPFLLTVDSVGHRTTVTCGAGLGHLIHLHHELPTMRMVHIEPYRMRLEDGALVLDSPDASPRPNSWAESLGATVPPWIFVVDGDGRLWAKFHGIFGSDELRSAIDTVSS